MSSEETALRLDVIAAKAKQLASDLRGRRLWEGDLYEGLSEIQKQVAAAISGSRRDR